mgnify:CR=1 FL=1
MCPTASIGNPTLTLPAYFSAGLGGIAALFFVAALPLLPFDCCVENLK